jgi:hypothetical protein
MSVSTIADIYTRSDNRGMGLVRSKHSLLLKKPIGTQSPAHLCTKMDTPSRHSRAKRSAVITTKNAIDRMRSLLEHGRQPRRFPVPIAVSIKGNPGYQWVHHAVTTMRRSPPIQRGQGSTHTDAHSIQCIRYAVIDSRVITGVVAQ